MSSDLQGRNAVVFGVANKRSIAWSIAQGLHAAGMKLAITYQNERLEQEAKDLILSDLKCGGFWSREQALDRVVDRAGIARRGHEISYHLSERAPGAGSEGPHPVPARCRSLHVRRVQG